MNKSKSYGIYFYQLFRKKIILNEIVISRSDFFSQQVTIPFSFDVIAGNGVFDSGIIDLMRRVTPTMMATGSTFSINIYPYFAYVYDPYVTLDFALGRAGSLFGAQLNLCRSALNNIGATSLSIIVGETGWPSAGGKGN